jgi:hypothetical protein
MMCFLPGHYNIKKSFLLNIVDILTNLGNSSTSETPIYSNLLIPTFMKSHLLNCLSFLIITPLCSCVSYLLLTTAVYCIYRVVYLTPLTFTDICIFPDYYCSRKSQLLSGVSCRIFTSPKKLTYQFLFPGYYNSRKFHSEQFILTDHYNSRKSYLLTCVSHLIITTPGNHIY